MSRAQSDGTRSNIENIGIVPFAAGDGTHRVEVIWNHKSRKFTVSVQQRYAGGAFTPTVAIGPIVASDTFGGNNTRLFFGGSGVYDDLAIVAVDAKKHGGGCAAQGLPRWGRKAAGTDAESFHEAVTQLCEALHGGP